jgi:thiamine-phosphate pyrophosphorylase
MTGATPRLIVFTPVLDKVEAGSFAARLEAFLGTADVASAVLRVAPGAGASVLAMLAPLARARDVALLIADDIDLASAQGADGAHVAHAATDLPAALARLKPQRIVGAGGLATRDDAMTAGEKGADYVMFGAEGDDERASARAVDLAAWWAEVMEPPCVGYAESLAQVADFVAAGVDFVALSPALWCTTEANALNTALRGET